MRIYVSNFVQLFCYVFHFVQKSTLFLIRKKEKKLPVLMSTGEFSLFLRYLLLFCHNRSAKINHNAKAD